MQIKAKQTAVITGAASGIGLMFARILAEKGLNLVLVDIEATPLEAVKKELESSHVQVLTKVMDVSQFEPWEALAKDIEKQLGAVHLLFNNAGVYVGNSLTEATLQDWEWTLGVNLWGCIHGVKAFLPGMMAHQMPAHIINTASMAGLISSAGMGVYNASKAAVVSFSETLHKDLYQSNIGVSVLCPMGVKTQIQSSERNRPSALSTEKGVHQPIALNGRWLDSAEVVEKIVSAIETEQLYVLTHQEGKAFWERRAHKITQAFPQ